MTAARRRGLTTCTEGKIWEPDGRAGERERERGGEGEKERKEDTETEEERRVGVR